MRKILKSTYVQLLIPIINFHLYHMGLLYTKSATARIHRYQSSSLEYVYYRTIEQRKKKKIKKNGNQ